MPVRIRALSSSEMPKLYPLIRLLNPSMKKTVFLKRLKTMVPQGYQAIGAFDNTRLIGCSGFWVGTRFWCGKQIDIDNFVVHPDYRGKRVGTRLLAWLERYAKKVQCDLMVLDVYTSNHLAHRFYFDYGFTATGYHMTKIPGSHKPLTHTEVHGG